MRQDFRSRRFSRSLNYQSKEASIVSKFWNMTKFMQSYDSISSDEDEEFSENADDDDDNIKSDQEWEDAPDIDLDNVCLFSHDSNEPPPVDCYCVAIFE